MKEKGGYAAHSASPSFAACIYSVVFVGPLLYGHVSSSLPNILVRSLEGLHAGVWWFLLHLIFPSHTPPLSLLPPYFLLFTVSSFLTPPRCLPAPPLHHHKQQPSPMPLSQLPVELAAVQDWADGSVIRSASLPSLFSSPLFSSLFSLSLI